MQAKGMFKSYFGALLWKLLEFKRVRQHQISAEFSPRFVLIVSVPRGNQSKTKIAFGDSYQY